MPLIIITKPTFPDLPLVPGVPSINRAANAIIQNTIASLADAIGLGGLFADQVWGLFGKDGDPVIIPDLIADMEYRRDKRISTAPQEEGAFVSYNKVSTPFQGRVTFVKGGSIDERNFFLNQIENAEAALDLFDFVMPEIVYPSVNVVHHDFRRSPNKGLSLLRVDVWIEQVRVTGTSSFSTTAAPSGAAPSSSGTVTPSTSPPSVSSSLSRTVSDSAASAPVSSGVPPGALT